MLTSFLAWATYLAQGKSKTSDANKVITPRFYFSIKLSIACLGLASNKENIMDIELKEKSDWTNFREKLNNNYKYNDDWKNAITLFNKRLERTFLKPIQSIIETGNEKEKGKGKGEGFTIVTAQCALIEMLSAFRQGKIFNHKKQRSSPIYEYSQSEEMFSDLLLKASIFQDIFWQLDTKNNKKTNQPYDASDFYKNVRCGLMHEARTKGNWYINNEPKEMSIENEKLFIVTRNDKKIIYRTVLHYRLLDYLNGIMSPKFRTAS